ncbi:MAG: SGNH/GDSL hydrolase family protein [Kiritimatiellia bacterium]
MKSWLGWVFALDMVLVAGGRTPPPDLAAYDWFEGTNATIEGTAFSEPGRLYARLPSAVQGKVPDSVWAMGGHSTGVNLRFVPDGHRLCFKWKVANPDSADAFMGPTAMTGLDVYRQEKDGTWKFAANPRIYYYGRETPGVYAMNWTPGQPCMVYLPLRSVVESFQIGVEKGTKIVPLPPHGAARRVVHYGTSIVHGGCVSRPGMAFAAQEGRLADVEVVNLGFSGAGRMEMSMCEVLASIDAAVYVLDCDWNMSVDLQRERYLPFVRELNRRHPQVPILLCGGCTQFDRPRAQETYARSVYGKLKAEDAVKWKNLLFLSGVDMLPKDGEATFDFCHPNDWGSMQMGRVYAAAIQRALCLVPPAADGFQRVSGLVTDRAFENGAWRLAGGTVYSTTNCTPRFGRKTRLDVAGHRLTLKMKDKSWDNTYFDAGSRVENSAAQPGRVVMDTVYGKLHLGNDAWKGGARNVLDVSQGRLYLRSAIAAPDCWTLRLGRETVMGGGVTGPDCGKYLWAGPVEVSDNVIFADDTNTAAGGWGCTMTGPLSGPDTATITLARAFCLRLGAPRNTFRGVWRLQGGGDGTFRCRLDLLKGAAFAGKSIQIFDSDLTMDRETAFKLPKIRHLHGAATLAGGAPGTRVAGLFKTGAGVLTLDTPATIDGPVRIEEGTLALGKTARPSIRRLFFMPGTVLDMNGQDLAVEELVGKPEIRNPGRLTAASSRDLAARKPQAAATLERLRQVGESRQFYWAWTEPWVTWGSLSDGVWPRFDTAVGALTARAPLMCYYDLAAVAGSREAPGYFDEHARVNIEAIRTHWRACRGIPVFSWHLDHPCTTNGFPQAWYRFKCKEHRNLVKDILDGTEYPCGQHRQWGRAQNAPAKSPRDWYFARMDQVARFLNRLIDDNGERIPVILRYQHEMDGSWFWWGDTWCTPAEFIAFSRLTADYLRAACGRENLLFAYTPDRTWKELGTEGDGQHNFLSWYPGDAYVDVLGFDDYSIGKGKDLAGQNANFAETLRKLRLVSDFARQHGKVMGITETGCKDAHDDFWTRLLNLATAEGVACAFVDTWGGPWTLPETEAQTADLKAFVGHPAVLTIPHRQLLQAADSDTPLH